MVDNDSEDYRNSFELRSNEEDNLAANNRWVDEHSRHYAMGYRDYFEHGSKLDTSGKSPYVQRNYAAGWEKAEDDDRRYGRPCYNEDEQPDCVQKGCSIIFDTVVFILIIIVTGIILMMILGWYQNYKG